MTDERYNVIITNDILAGHNLDEVKAHFGRQFKLDSTHVDAIFKNDISIIKRNIDKETANKYIISLNKIGVDARMDAIDSEADRPSAIPNTEPNQSKVEEKIATAEKIKTSEATAYSFSFSAREGEYFRIWIVNLLLTIITLGIYSAWAKVRNTQYIYGHTSIAGSSFAYLATPIAILKSRLIAIAAFVIYALTQSFFPFISFGLTILFIIAIPWIITRALSFQLRMTGWRNLRFGFDGKTKGAAIAFILWPLVGAITLGLMFPYALYKQTQYIFNNIRLGTSKVHFEPCTKPYILVFFIAFGGIIAAAIVGMILGGLISPILSFLLIMASYLFAFIYISVRIGNLKLNQSSLHDGKISFVSTMDEPSFAKVFIINSLLIMLTLGLYAPCAKVALTRYRIERLEAYSTTELDHFIAAEEEKISALGEELGEAFDIDIAI